MNPDFLDKLNRAYGEVRESYGGEFKITDINTSQNADTTPRSTAGQVVESILELFPSRS